MDKKSDGFTLVELIIVIAILAIISSIAAPTYIKYVQEAKKQVCSINRQQFLRMYNTSLIMNDQKDSSSLLEKYLLENGQNICPEGGVISIIDNDVHCEIHSDGEENDGDEDDTVPYL